MRARIGRLVMRARLVAGAVLAAAVLTAVGSISAMAHTGLVGSTPSDGASLNRAPSAVSLDFTRDVSAPLTRAKLVDGEGRAVPLPPGAISADSDHSRRIVVALPPGLAKGSYRLSFVTYDGVDLHETSDSVVFGVGAAPTLAPQQPTVPVPRASEALLRWLAFAGLAAIIGSLAVALFVLPAALPGGAELARCQAALLLLAGAGVAGVVTGETGLLVTQAADAGTLPGTLTPILAASDFGRRWLVSVTVAAGLLPLLLWLRRRPGRGLPLPSPLAELRSEGAWVLLHTSTRTLLLALGQALALAVSAHAGADSSLTLSSVLVRGAHLLAVSAWAGGLVALGVTLTVLRRASAWAAVPSVVRRFSLLAAASFVMAVVSGLILAGQEVATVTALLSTRYGATLIVKTVLVALVGLIAVRHARLALRGSARVARGLSATVGLEAVGALAVILVAGVLASTLPALGRQFDPPAAVPPPRAATNQVDGLILRVSAKPNLPGSNRLQVNVINTRRPVPAPIRRVLIIIRDPGGLPPLEREAGLVQGSLYDAGTVDMGPGEQSISVRVERDGLPATDEQLLWTVNAAEAPRQRVVLSAAPIAPIAQLLAVAITAVSLLVVAAVLGFRRFKPGLQRHRRTVQPTVPATSDGGSSR